VLENAFPATGTPALPPPETDRQRRIFTVEFYQTHSRGGWFAGRPLQFFSRPSRKGWFPSPLPGAAPAIFRRREVPLCSWRTALVGRRRGRHFMTSLPRRPDRLWN